MDAERRRWLIAGAAVLSLPLLYFVIAGALAAVGWNVGPLVMLGLWLGAGLALGSIFGVGPGGQPGAAPGVRAPRWPFVLWGAVAAGIIAVLIRRDGADLFAALRPIAQVMFVFAVAIFVFATRHKGIGVVLGAIVAGAIAIALFSAVTSSLP